jgi:DNA transformation protein
VGVTPSYREYIVDQLSGLGEVVVKRMFGGLGLYSEGAFFGLVDDDTVYLRVDDTTRPEFVARGMEAFRPVRSQPEKVSLNYYQLPANVLEDGDELVVWARRAIKAAKSPTAGAAKRKKAGPAKRKKAGPAKRKKAAPAKRTRR